MTLQRVVLFCRRYCEFRLVRLPRKCRESQEQSDPGFEGVETGVAILQDCGNVQGYCERFQKSPHRTTQELVWGVGGAGCVHCVEEVVFDEMQGFAVYKVSGYFQVNKEGPSEASLEFGGGGEVSAYFAF